MFYYFSFSSVSGRPSHVSKLRSEFDSGNSSVSCSVFLPFILTRAYQVPITT